MQTFLPYPDFQKSAEVLDYRRLGKQRSECIQIFNALRARITNTKYGWKTHTATRMWIGHEAALLDYARVICTEWRARGYKDTMLPKFTKLAEEYGPVKMPPWLGDEAVHASHRGNLIRKYPEFYQKFGWTESPDLPYVWPTTQPEEKGTK